MALRSTGVTEGSACSEGGGGAGSAGATRRFATDHLDHVDAAIPTRQAAVDALPG